MEGMVAVEVISIKNVASVSSSTSQLSSAALLSCPCLLVLPCPPVDSRRIHMHRQSRESTTSLLPRHRFIELNNASNSLFTNVVGALLTNCSNRCLSPLSLHSAAADEKSPHLIHRSIRCLVSHRGT